MTVTTVGSRLIAALSAAVVLLATAPTAAAHAADAGKPAVRHADTPTAVPGSYIVVLKNARTARSAVNATARSLTTRVGGTPGRTYSAALRGFSATLSRAAAERLAADPAVAYVEQNQVVSTQDSQSTPPSWGLDRVDQRSLPLDAGYSYPQAAEGVRAYIIDTGIAFGHREFGGRAVSGFDAVDGGPADDCNGHGTHVAGTVGGATYGVAKEVTLVGVRVLNCDGRGTSAEIVAGIDWVTANAVRPAVANMSLGSGVNSSVDDAVQASIASGVSYTLAAGNSANDACNSSPARVADALTVAASDADDASAIFTSRGPCVDLYAPGVAITSAWWTGDTATRTIDGTSMAAPHVAGVSALFLGEHPAWTPPQVHAAVLGTATPGIVTGVPPGTANRLLFSGEVRAPADDFTVAATPTDVGVTAGASVTTTVGTRVTRGSTQRVTLGVSGLPAGAIAVFNQGALDAGGAARLTVHTTDNTPAGRYPLSVSALGAAVVRWTPLTLTVAGAPGCRGANGTLLSIPDFDGPPASSPVVISGCDRAASPDATVTVDIRHGYRGDVVIDLVAPDGGAYRLKDHDARDIEPDVRETYPVDLADRHAEGTWELVVRDAAPSDVGAIASWSLVL